MSLSIEQRSIGDITVLSCRGRVVEGDESLALESCVNTLLPLQPHIVLDLSGVTFIDSSGLGLLLRLRTAARGADGDVKTCAANDRLREVLRVTRLAAVLPTYNSEGEAIAAFYTPADADDRRVSLEVDVLCVHTSPDVLAYARELLKRAGFGVTTTANISDARMLLRATRPRVLVIPSEWRSALIEFSGDKRDTRVAVIEWPAEFSTEDPGEAARHLLEQVSRVLASRP